MERKPEGVRKARLAGNVEALSAMGRNGTRRAQENRVLAEKRRQAIMKKGMLENHFQANEHIVSPDGEEGEFPDGIIRAA